jgi:hypothetical protein
MLVGKNHIIKVSDVVHCMFIDTVVGTLVEYTVARVMVNNVVIHVIKLLYVDITSVLN